MQSRERDNPRKQIAKMRKLFPQFRGRVIANSGVVWTGTLRPLDTSTTYQVRVHHTAGEAPKVFVDAPALQKGAPHRYSDGSLCLSWHKDWSWSPQAVMAETLVPWAAMWLFFYELWIVTGEWLGPEAPHAKKR